MFKNKIGKLSKSSLIPGQRGFTLIEVLIAIALFGIIAAGIFFALGTSNKIAATTRTQETAKDLAISEMENVKSQPYASNYTVFNPSSVQVGTVIRIPAGSGWVNSDTISRVTVGGITAVASLTVDSSGNLSGTITVPPVGTGFQTVTITGTTSGTRTFNNAFNVTAAAVTPQSLAEYNNYISNLIVTVYDQHEQRIDIIIWLNGKNLFSLTSYRTDY